MQEAALLEKQEDRVVNRVKLDHKVMSNNIKDIRDRMDDYVVGQGEAKDALCAALVRALNYNPDQTKPLGAFMFLGPSGVGKTELVRALARILYSDDNVELGNSKIDCNLFTEDHAVSELLGSPSGYEGGDNIPLLADTYMFQHFKEAKVVHPILEGFEDFGILLLDEIEKAHFKFYDIFLGIMDYGTVKLRRGNVDGEAKKKGVNFSKVTNFRNVLIIMTSNLGAEELSKKASGKSIAMGFHPSKSNEISVPREFYKEKLEESLFRTEFLKRLTDYIPFNFLTKVDYYTILEMQVNNKNHKMEDKDIEISLSKKLKSHFVNKALKGNIGGRTLATNFENEIDTALSNLLVNGEISKNENSYNRSIKLIDFDVEDDEVVTYGVFSKSKTGEKQKRKKKIRNSRRKLCSDEVVVSLYNESFLLTLRDQITPKVSYLRSLYIFKDELSKDFEKEIEELEMELEVWGLTETDFLIIKREIVLNKYEDFHDFYAEVEGVRLWGDKQFYNTFDGKIRYVEKYVRNYFDKNKDSKYLISEGAGTMDELLVPIIEFVEKMISRQVTFEEENILISIFHREYIKQYEKPPKQSEDKVETEAKEPEGAKQKTSALRKLAEAIDKKSTTNDVTVNFNFYSDSKEKKTFKNRLKKLFKDDFDQVLESVDFGLENSYDIKSILLDVKSKIGDISDKQNSVLKKFIKKQKKKKEK